MAFLSKYGVARHIYIPITKRAVVDFAVGADWTPAAGDVKISKDGGAAANVTNLPVAIVMGNTAVWNFSLTATEMQAALVVVTVADSATKAVEDKVIEIETYGNASAQHELDLDTPVASSVWGQAMTELAAVPAMTDSVLAGLEWLVMVARNKRTQTSTTETLYKNDGTTVVATSAKADSGGTFTRAKYT